MEFERPWVAVNPPDPPGSIHGLVVEALREIGPGHPLYQKELEAIARRIDCDDVLFLIRSTSEVAVVHLTWTRDRIERLPCPDTEILASMDAFQARMRADAIEWRDG
jgi:hypothetical protein